MSFDQRSGLRGPNARKSRVIRIDLDDPGSANRQVQRTGGVPTSRVGCCRDQHPRVQKLIPLSPATAAAVSPCQHPSRTGPGALPASARPWTRAILFKQAHGPARQAAHRQGHCLDHPLKQIYPEICASSQRTTGERPWDRAVSKPVICSPICSHALRPIGEKSIGATGFEPAT